MTARAIKGNNVSRAALGNSDDAKVGASSTTGEVVALDLALFRDFTGKAVAVAIGAFNLDTKPGLGAEEGGTLPDGVDGELDKGLAAGIRIGTGDIVGPVAERVRILAPDASLGTNTGTVDVKVGSSLLPVGDAGNSEGGHGINDGGDKHGLVAGQNSLAVGNLLGAVVDGLDGAGAGDTVGLAWEGLLDVAVVVAVETAVHRGRIGVGRVWVPLVHDHALLAGDGAVVAGLAGLVRAQSPAGILLVRSDGDEIWVVGRKGAGAALDDRGDGAGEALESAVVLMV